MTSKTFIMRQNNYFPLFFQNFKKILLQRDGDEKKNNYRPISILSLVSKRFKNVF